MAAPGDLLGSFLQPLPLVPILRGVTPEEAGAMAEVLLAAGFRILEVPLNSPRPFASIEIMARQAGEHALVGAGTVLDSADVGRLADCGARLVVMPHADVEIIATAKRQGLLAIPGVATPTEAFAALRAGADALKLFPAELVQPPIVRAMRAVLPRDCRLLPVGGILPETMAAFVDAGASGFGIGSALYRPGLTPAEVGQRAKRFAEAWAALAGSLAC